MENDIVVETRGLDKVYKLGTVCVNALEDINLKITRGEFLSIMGPSGCGKSTLMNLVGCLDRPTSGKVILDGIDISTLSDNRLADIRNKKVGFVFQTFNLLPRLTAEENVELPLIYAGVNLNTRGKLSHQLLEDVGIGDRAHHKPPELSGGQRQKVAIARALINNPSIILADEPTGNLDSKSGAEIMQIFHKLNLAGATIVMVTHNPDIAKVTKRIVYLKDGKIVGDERL